MPTKKKVSKPRPRGRPPISEGDEKARRRVWKADGDRIRAAIAGLGYANQTAFAEHAGLTKSRLSEFMNGDRDIPREELRKIGSKGVSIDFLLGLTAANLPPNQSRPRNELEDELAAFVLRKIEQRLPTHDMDPQLKWSWDVSAPALMEFVVERVAEIAQAQATDAIRIARIRRTLNTLSEVASSISLEMHALKGSDPQAMFSSAFLDDDRLEKLLDVADSLYDDMRLDAPPGPIRLTWSLGRSEPWKPRPTREMVEVINEPLEEKKSPRARRSARSK